MFGVQGRLQILQAGREPEGEALVLEALGSNEASVWAEAVAVLGQRTGADHGRDAAAWRVELAKAKTR